MLQHATSLIIDELYQWKIEDYRYREKDLLGTYDIENPRNFLPSTLLRFHEFIFHQFLLHSLKDLSKK